MWRLGFASHPPRASCRSPAIVHLLSLPPFAPKGVMDTNGDPGTPSASCADNSSNSPLSQSLTRPGSGRQPGVAALVDAVRSKSEARLQDALEAYRQAHGSFRGGWGCGYGGRRFGGRADGSYRRGCGWEMWGQAVVEMGGSSCRSVWGVGDDVGYGFGWAWVGGDEGNGCGGSYRGGRSGDGAPAVPWFPHLLILAVTLTGTNERHTLTGHTLTALPHASPRLTFARTHSFFTLFYSHSTQASTNVTP